MRFVVAKHDGTKCHGCPALIMRGEDMVIIQIKPKAVLTFHTTCYISWYIEKFNSWWAAWKHGSGNITRSKLGRPPIHTNPNREQVLNRLRSNKSYYQKLGDKKMVEIVQQRIDKYKKSHPR